MIERTSAESIRGQRLIQSLKLARTKKGDNETGIKWIHMTTLATTTQMGMTIHLPVLRM
jgi:hypothetical protein